MAPARSTLGERRRGIRERRRGELLRPHQLLLAVLPLGEGGRHDAVPSGRNFTGPMTVVMSVAATASRIFAWSVEPALEMAAARIYTHA